MVRFFAILVCTLLLAACAGMVSFPAEVEELTGEAIDALIAEDKAWLDGHLPDTVTGDPSYEATLALMFMNLPQGEESDRQAISRSVFRRAGNGAGETTYTSLWAVDFTDDSRLLVEVAVVQDEAGEMLVRLYYEIADETVPTGFSLAEKSPWQLGFLGALFLSVLFTLGTAVAVIVRWRRLRSPVRWLLISLLGGGKIIMDWHSGALTVQTLAVGLFGGGVVQYGYGPMVLIIHLPVGALLFWLMAKGRDEADGPDHADPPVDKQA